MANEKDIRYLIKCEEWEEDYFDNRLVKASENIQREVDKLRGVRSYDTYIKDKNADINEDIKIIQLSGILELFNTSPLDAFEVLDASGFKYKTKAEVLRALNYRIFDKQVEIEKAKAEKTIKGEKKITFEEMCIPIEAHFKLTLDYDITVTKFIAWENRLKAVNNGR